MLCFLIWSVLLLLKLGDLSAWEKASQISGNGFASVYTSAGTSQPWCVIPLLFNFWTSAEQSLAVMTSGMGLCVDWEVAEGLHVHFAGDPTHHKWTFVSRGGCTHGTATWCSAGIPALGKEPFFWWRWNVGRKNLPGIRSVLSTNPFSLQKYMRSRQGTWPRLGSTSPLTALCISICACWDGGGVENGTILTN